MVSIITVVKNGSNTIERTILSVINQNFSDYEYIIIDGVSTDGTLGIIEKYSDKICTILSEPDKGIYDAMNKGIALSKGEWIYFLGCDDILYDNSTLTKVFSAQLNDVDVIYGNVEFLHSGEIYDGEYNYDKLCLRSPCHQAVFYKKALFEKYGYFDTCYLTASDYVLHVKTFCAGVNWKYFDQIIAVYNEKGASARSRMDKTFNKELFRICFDNFNNKISDMTLSRIFYSAFPHFMVSHEFSESYKYFSQVINKVGFFKLLRNFFILFYRYKIRNEQA
jgi:glycosyltransferase involved in cell wall biosynthesis